MNYAGKATFDYIYGDFDRQNRSTAHQIPNIIRYITATAAGQEWSCHWPEEQPGGERNFTENFQTVPGLYAILVLTPIFLVLVTIGSTLIIAIQVLEPRKTSTNVYLTSMAISNFIFVWFNVSGLLVLAEKQSISLPSYILVLKNFYGTRQWVVNGCSWFSDCTLIIYSFERLLTTVKPLVFRNFFTVKRAIIAESIIAFLSAVFTLQHIVTNTYGYLHHNQYPPALLLWRNIQERVEVVRVFFTWIVLTTTNLILLTVLYWNYRTKLKSEMRSNRPSSLAEAAQRNSTVILLSSVLMYSLTEFPYAIHKALLVTSSYPFCSFDYETNNTRVLVEPVVLIVSKINYTFDFYLYCLISKIFRKKLVSLCRRVRQKLGLCDGQLQLQPDDRRESNISLLDVSASALGRGSLVPSRVLDGLVRMTSSSGYERQKNALEEEITLESVNL